MVGLVVGATTLIASWTSEIGNAYSHLAYVQDNQALLERVWQFDAGDDGINAAMQNQLPAPPDVDPTWVKRLQATAPRAHVIPLYELRAANGGALPPYFIDVTDSTLNAQYSSVPIMSLATSELLDSYRVSSDVRARLRHDGAVVVMPPARRAPRRVHPGNTRVTVIHVADIVRSGQVSIGLPRVLVSPALVRRLGWQPQFSGSLALVADSKFTPRERARLKLLEDDINWAATMRQPGAQGAQYVQTMLTIGTGSYHVASAFPLRAAGFGAACVLVLAVVAVGLVLNARDSDDERAMLEATGVVPRVRRQIGTRKAALIVMTGAAIAIPIALIPIAVFVTTSDGHTATFRVDWVALAAMGIGLPLVVSAAAAVGGYARDALRPRRPVLLLED